MNFFYLVDGLRTGERLTEKVTIWLYIAVATFPLCENQLF